MVSWPGGDRWGRLLPQKHIFNWTIQTIGPLFLFHSVLNQMTSTNPCVLRYRTSNSRRRFSVKIGKIVIVTIYAKVDIDFIYICTLRVFFSWILMAVIHTARFFLYKKYDKNTHPTKHATLHRTELVSQCTNSSLQKNCPGKELRRRSKYAKAAKPS